MSSDEPEFEPPEPSPGLDVGQGPGVGNVLGFSLLFRERRALLALNRRSLATGVRLQDYEAVIPGVRFPIRGPLVPTKFRNHRCRVVQATLAIEDRALRPWLRERLVGQTVLGQKLGEIEIELRRGLPGAAQPRPCLMIHASGADGGPRWLLVAFDLEPVHRLLVLRPCRLWLVGDLEEARGSSSDELGDPSSLDRNGRDTSARRLWRAIARRLAGPTVAGVSRGVIVSEDGSLTIDVGRLALTRAFAGVGWKAPNLDGCAVEQLGLTRRGLTVELRGSLAEFGDELEPGSGPGLGMVEPSASAAARVVAAPVPGELGLLDEPIARGLDRVRELLRGRHPDGWQPALDQLRELSRELVEFPAAHLALVRWRVTLARFLDRDACLEAVYEWLDLQPSASEPRRLVAILLAAADRPQELARLLASACRQPHPPATQARLELAVAALLIDRLDDARSALSIVGPLTQRIRDQLGARRDRRTVRRTPASDRANDEPDDSREHAALRALLPDALLVLARARVAEVVREGRSLAAVPHVLEALDEALEATSNPRRRADMRASIADAFARHAGELRDDRRASVRALALLEAAIADDPDDDDLLDRAISIAERIDERATAATLLGARLARAPAEQRLSVRKRLIRVAAELDDPEHRELARRELTIALEQEPEDPALLRRAAGLARKLGDARAAAELLGRLLELDDYGEITLDDRDALTLERARLLRRSGQIDEAWERLRPALAGVPEQPSEDDPSSRRWILDVLELALELAPPTDRPRILDRLIAHASGQRRGEALVERAAQALRVEDRLVDLWAAVTELDAPAQLLAQIEQLLDDRDEHGLAQLAAIAFELRERTTELLARARLGRTLLAGDAIADATVELERAHELAPERLDLRASLADAYERGDRLEDAIPLVHALIQADLDASLDQRGQLTLRLARMLRAIDAHEQAAELLVACERLLVGAEPGQVSEAIRDAVAEQSFVALRELADDPRALVVALGHAAALTAELAATDRPNPALGQRLGAWLARAAQVLDEAGVDEIADLDLDPQSVAGPAGLPRTRVGLLERAVELRPDDLDLADTLEAVLRELGDFVGLERHLRDQIATPTEPERRASSLERLIATLERGPARDNELRGLLEELLVLRPDHDAALLRLGRLRFDAGERAEARELWTRAAERLDPDDPRLFTPALELARAALDDGDLALAHQFAARARTLEPDRTEPLGLLAAIARGRSDLAGATEALATQLDLAVAAGSDQIAELELELGLTLAEWFERDADPAIARAALDRLPALERLDRGPTRVPAIRTWLGIASSLADLDQQARARAALREQLGRELEVHEWIAEIELLGLGLDRPAAALDRCEAALAQHPGEPGLIAALARVLTARPRAPELLDRGHRSVRALVTSLGPSPAKTQAAELLVELGRRRMDPATVAFGLDQLDPERLEHGELARLRDWAIRKLDRVPDEIANVESKLVGAGLSSERRRLLSDRLLGLLDQDRGQTSARLLELGEQAEREVASSLAEAALDLLAPALAESTILDRSTLELAIAGLRSLARHGAVVTILARWSPIEHAVIRAAELGPLAELVELAASSDHPELCSRADALLTAQLPEHPEDLGLVRGLWARSSGDLLLADDDRGRASIAARAAAWIEQLGSSRELPASTVAALLDALASVLESKLDSQAAATLLRERADANIDDTALFMALLDRLRVRRRWPELLTLLDRAAELGLTIAATPATWLAIADAAAVAGDRASEAQARERAGDRLAAAAGLVERWVDASERLELELELAEAAVAQFDRSLALEPDHAPLRWRLGLARVQLGQPRAAYAHLLALVDSEHWSRTGIELGELAMRCGELAAELGEPERAVELLSLAHVRIGAERRDRVGEILFAALVVLDRREAAIQLASTCASELEQPGAAVAWLLRAAALAEGPRKIDLLDRARELAPDDDQLADALELELRELDDRPALVTLLRDRVVRGRPNQLDDRDAVARSIAAIEGLVELLGRAAELVASDELDELVLGAQPREQAEIVALCQELLRLDPDHREALMTVAGEARRLGRREQALALWARAEPQLDADDPRLFEVASVLADQHAAANELDQAYPLSERALAIRPDHLESLERRHQLACALDQPELVLVAAATLLERAPDLGGQRIAELYADIARARSLLGQTDAAIAAIEQATAHVEVGTELHRRLVADWLALLEQPATAMARVPVVAARRELAARVELRRALGLGLTRSQALAELDLLVQLGEWDAASERLELMLIAEPEAEDLRTRLALLDPNEPERGPGLSERGLRALRRVVDAIPAGPIRDPLARTLALDSRALEAARTALDALDRLSGHVAAEPEMLDLRVWAVRKLDRVEDELRELDLLLAQAGSQDNSDRVGDPVLLDRLVRVLEHDAEACATRLTEIATGTAGVVANPRAQVWLLESALTLVRQHTPDRVAFGVRALAALLERLGDSRVLVEIDRDEQAARERVADARHSWQQLAAAALTQANRDRRALDQVCALVVVADRAAAASLPGFVELGEMLLDRATVDYPDYAPLHELAATRSLDDLGAALGRLERLADSHRVDARGRARLYLGLAVTLSDQPDSSTGNDDPASSPRRKFLRDLAGYHANEPAIFAPLREALRQLGAFAELIAVLDVVVASPEQWLELAEDAAAAADHLAEAAARRRAGVALFERASTGDPTELERACVQLARALDLEPHDARTEYQYGLALERAGQPSAAFGLLVALLDERRYPSAGLEPGPLARRCGLLAIEIGQPQRAIELLAQAYEQLTRTRARVGVAERLFALLVEDPSSTGQPQHAAKLAREVAELLEAERGRATDELDGSNALVWLERAATLEPDQDRRADLHARAHALAPDVDRLADAYEDSLRALGRTAAIATLLRERIAAGLQTGDRAQTVGLLERLLALGDPLGAGAEPEPVGSALRDRAELLEQLLRLAPDRVEARLELASLRLREGDREAATGHWRALAQRLPSDDRRFLEPARTLARFALDAGELDQARAWLERARTIDPDDRTSVERLLEVALVLDDPELVLSTSASLLERAPTTGPSSRAALLRERASAFERLERPDRALAEIREAASVSELGSDDHVEAARQWLRLATSAGHGLTQADQVRAHAELEAAARAELREALGRRLPARAYIAESELLAERLDRRGPAIDLLFEGLRRNPSDHDLLAAYEELCTTAGEQRRFVGSLAELLVEIDPDDPSAVIRLGEKLARAARAIEDPPTCLAALEALPPEFAERPELLELRDWAVRGLGRVDEELDRLDAKLLALGPGGSNERLQASVTRMLRLLGDAGEPAAARLLGLADRPGLDPELARAFTRAALRTAREYAPDQLDITIATLRATLARDSIQSVDALWPGVESLALATNQLASLVDLLGLATAAERAGDEAQGPRIDRLIAAALRLAPEDRAVHGQLLDRLGWSDHATADSLARLVGKLDALAVELEFDGPRLAALWSGALERIDYRRPDLREPIAAIVRARALAALDEPSPNAEWPPPKFAALLGLLERRECWAIVLELTVRAERPDAELPLARLDTIAKAAARAGDFETRMHARIELGLRCAAAREFMSAAEAFADALTVAPSRFDLQYRLGDALARAGRTDAALEQLLPLLARKDLAAVLSTIPGPVDQVALASRCGALLASVGSHERAAAIYERAFEASTIADPRRPAIAEAMFDIRVRLGESELAAAIATIAAAESRDRPELHLAWLLRVADHGEPRRRLEALAEAHALRPDHALTTRLEAALEQFGEAERLETLLHARIEQARVVARDPLTSAATRVEARALGAAALRKLIELGRSQAVSRGRTQPATELVQRWVVLLEFVPDDLDASLALADAYDQLGDRAAAATLWRRVGELVPRDDDRFFGPARRLAAIAREQGDLDDVRALIERALTIRPGDLDALDDQRELAIAADDPALHLRAIEALLDHPDRAGQRVTLQLEAARAHASLAVRRSRNLELDPESLAAAITWFERAAAAADPGSARHREVAQAWLELVATESTPRPGARALDPGDRSSIAHEREASARAELRAAFGPELSAADLRSEAGLLALGLGRVDEGLSLVEAGLLENPDDSLLLSAFKDLCLATGAHARYADALEAAILVLEGDTDARETRDRLATELAFTAIELDDANRLLAQLEHMSPDRASSPELLDLREWAIRKLGRVEDELTDIDRELLATRSDPETAVLVERLLRMLDLSYDETGRRLVMLAGRAEPSVAARLRDATIELARNADASYFEIVLGAIEHSLGEAALGGPPSAQLVAHWPSIEKLALERDDPGLLALLIDLGERAVTVGLTALEPRVAELRDLALLRHPDSPELHALVMGPLEVELATLDPDARIARADAALDQLADHLRAVGRKRALLWVGFAKLLERREGATLLVRRARVELDDNPMFLALVDALEDGNHWSRALELLEYRVVQDGEPDRQVDDLKHLAHLCADILGDPDAAIGHLERALDYAPEDPDLMLPLLDHYYAKPQLDRAIDLSARVLASVPMGAVAFAALGHRAADAALATGEHALAEQLLRKILGRAPDDARTRDRLRELEQLADDPEHRVRMLAAIANRTTSSSRVEALEERARLLIHPLGRVEEAIADLEAVIVEAPGRRATAMLLADLYEQRQRWPALVATLEREYPRQQSLDRVLTLQRIALIQRDRLGEPSRAEKALRLALDNLDSVGLTRLAELLELRPSLRAELLAPHATAEPETEPVFEESVEGVVLPDDLTRPSAPTAALVGPVTPALAHQAWAQLADRLHLEIVTCLAQQGRFSELIVHLDSELAAELAGELDPRERFPEIPAEHNPRLLLLQRLAKALRDHVDEPERTAAVYVRLEQLDALPDEGLATLARWYRGQQRYDDLVRILTVRSRKLASLGDWDRKAEADFRIGELLEGPLRRPHEAARFFLDAYLANPFENPAAGARARVLLAGTDSVANVRNRLLLRLAELRDPYKPALLTLLGDLLSPHDEHETEAERRYREALALTPTLANALEGLGRLLSRQGRLEAAIEPLILAARSRDIPDDRAADDAASAARALVELGRGAEAEAVLEQALVRAPDSQRSLLELARLYDRLDRKLDEARVLDRLAGLPLSSMLRAEVGYRQAMLLAPEFRDDPMSEAGERARALLLEAVGADAMHTQARHVLLELASARSEWSIVAHMHFLAIRELPPGPRRALTHLDLADTYLDRLSDAQSAVRNLGAALAQAPTDVVVSNRANALLARLPDPGDAAVRLEQFSRSPGRPELGELMTDAARAQLRLVASDLHLRNDTLEPAEAAVRSALELADLPVELREQAERALEQIIQIDHGEFDLRKRRKSLVHQLEQTEDPLARLQLFTRLRETARRLDDHEDLEQITRQQLELAHALLATHKPAALATLRNVFAEAGDYARVVSLYEDLAGRTGDAVEAAELLTSAARFAWSGLRDAKLAVAIVRRALDRAPTHGPATELLGEIAGASDEREVDETICDELSQLAPRQRPPLLTLRLAEAALRLERREQAQGVLRQLLAGEASVELRLQASSLLDGLLESAGRTHDRIPLLEERLELCRRHWPDRAADVALDLARAQRSVGNLQDARATCRTALLDKPSDQPLTKLYAELLEQAEDWLALARALEQLANLTIETREQAHWLTRAAQVHLDHGTDGRESIGSARRLLERARAVSLESTEARAVLLPLAFHQGDWERLLELAIELRSIAGDEHEALIYAALTEAFARGKRTLARSIGDRHDRSVRQRILWPVCARMLELIATEGPLPRLDAVLSAAAALCGGTEELLDELGAWAAGQPLRAGLALGLARLNEAFRRMELARHLYQIAAFMAPAGPVPALTTRLPTIELPRAPIHADNWISLEWRGALREVMLTLREPLAGVRGKSVGARPPRTPKERLAVRHAAQAVAAWRIPLGLELQFAVTEQPLVAGIGVRNLAQPTIVVNEGFVDVPEVERRYRLAYAAAATATGLALVLDDDPIGLPDLLDALSSLVKPRHEPGTDAARALVDTLAARGITASKLDADLRRSLARELDHWCSAPAKLERVIHRACMLIATRLSGQVDGALAAMARDRGLLAEPGKVDPAILETSNAAWLLRSLGVFGGQS